MLCSRGVLSFAVFGPGITLFLGNFVYLFIYLSLSLSLLLLFPLYRVVFFLTMFDVNACCVFVANTIVHFAIPFIYFSDFLLWLASKRHTFSCPFPSKQYGYSLYLIWYAETLFDYIIGESIRHDITAIYQHLYHARCGIPFFLVHQFHSVSLDTRNARKTDEQSICMWIVHFSSYANKPVAIWFNTHKYWFHNKWMGYSFFPIKCIDINIDRTKWMNEWKTDEIQWQIPHKVLRIIL